ncbi:hypothetical protein SAMN05421748_14017 [Paractinoplanes atraurantiacus]|uniref:Uncharacterized protein n=2 Tax=Paractinoplanes atraurantiacus TaxID=1036182 RepID=A0A285KGK8_9ACTN|nr:hypothetical protein SAMN05421748_14017 [Actinoplanes atraurantiacus]
MGSLGKLLHRTTHRVPGVPAHAERPAGHQGTGFRPSLNSRRNHTSARPPRYVVAVAAFFGREL